MSDFYQDSAEARMERLNYQRQMALVNLQEAKLTGDLHSGGEYAQEIADIDAAKANLIRLHNSYIQNQQGQYQAPQSPEELRVKPAEKMTWQDGLDVSLANSKYGKGIDANDPNVQRGFREVQRRRQANENQG
jgi:hypothetical protein